MFWGSESRYDRMKAVLTPWRPFRYSCFVTAVVCMFWHNENHFGILRAALTQWERFWHNEKRFDIVRAVLTQWKRYNVTHFDIVTTFFTQFILWNYKNIDCHIYAKKNCTWSARIIFCYICKYIIISMRGT